MTMFFRLLFLDLKDGFRFNQRKLAAVSAVTVLSFLWFGLSLKEGYSMGIIHEQPGFADMVLFLVRGMKPLDHQSGETYSIPVVWLLNQTMIHLMTGSYPFHYTIGYDQQIMIRLPYKTWWWYSKCIWNTFTVTTYYFLILLITAGICLFWQGNLSLHRFSVELSETLYQSDFSRITIQKLWFQMTFMPWCISVGLSLWQMFLGLLAGPRVAFVLVLGLLSASTFLFHPGMIGNYSMVLRCDAVFSGGMMAGKGILIAAGMAGISVLGGRLLIAGKELR